MTRSSTRSTCPVPWIIRTASFSASARHGVQARLAADRRERVEVDRRSVVDVLVAPRRSARARSCRHQDAAPRGDDEVGVEAQPAPGRSIPSGAGTCSPPGTAPYGSGRDGSGTSRSRWRHRGPAGRGARRRATRVGPSPSQERAGQRDQRRRAPWRAGRPSPQPTTDRELRRPRRRARPGRGRPAGPGGRRGRRRARRGTAPAARRAPGRRTAAGPARRRPAAGRRVRRRGRSAARPSGCGPARGCATAAARSPRSRRTTVGRDVAERRAAGGWRGR